MTLSSMHQMLLDGMEPDVWYDCYPDQGTGGKILPDWFYRQQAKPMTTIRALIESGEVMEQVIKGFPQILKPYMRELKRFRKFTKP